MLAAAQPSAVYLRAAQWEVATRGWAVSGRPQRQVLQAMDHYYTAENSNVHRGVHHLSNLATAAYEDARRKVATFIGAATDREVVFTRNATEAVNLVAQTWGLQNLKPGDEVVFVI